MLPDERTIAYTAGFFDGEGCLGDYGKSRYSARIAQGEANDGGEILATLREQWGGLGSIHKYRKRHRDQEWHVFEWQIGGAWQIERFLAALAPHLRIKRAKAERLLATVREHIATRRYSFTPEQDRIIRDRWSDRSISLKRLAKLAGHSETGLRKRARLFNLPDRRKAKAYVRYSCR